MRKLKLAVVLLALMSGVEGILWYGEFHSRPSVPSYLGMVSPAIPIRNGLDFPATLASLLITTAWNTCSGQMILGTPARFLFLSCVAGSWSFIGNWFDHRVTEEEQSKLGTLIVCCPVFPPLVLALGLFTLLASFHLHIESFTETIERALLHTWAVFLIGVPVLGIAHPAAEDRRHDQSTKSEQRPRRPISNFRMFMVIIGVFAVLLILGTLTSPAGPK